MKKYLILLVLFLVLPFGVSAKEVKVTLFYGKECPFCHQEIIYLDKLKKQFGDNIVINKYEVWHDKDNAELMKKVRGNLNDSLDAGIPYLVIGKSSFTGYNSTIGKKIKKTILENIASDEADPLATLNEVNECEEESCALHDSNQVTMHMPILGKVDVKKTNSYLLSLTSGIGDLFNYYSIFVMFVLFGLLLGIYNNKRRWILGSIFVIFSSIFYFLMGLLNISVSDTILTISKAFISIILIFIGGILLDYHTKIKFSKDSVLEIMQNKFKNKEMVFYGLFVILFSLIISLIGIHFAGGVPSLLKAALEFKGISGFSLFLNLFTYFAGYLIAFYIMFVIMNVIVKEVFKENSIGVYNRLIGSVLFLVLAFVLIAFSSLFMF